MPRAINTSPKPIPSSPGYNRSKAWQIQNSSKATAEAEENCFWETMDMIYIYSNYNKVCSSHSSHHQGDESM
jgi:hypothetical protein